MNITKNQHYVPEKYLKEWISKDGTISINNNGKVICAKSVYYYAQENFFYKYEKLNYHEFCILIDYIKKNALIPHNDLQVYLTSCYSPVIYETIDNDELNDDFNRIMLKIIEEKLFDAQSIILIHMYIKFKKMIEAIGKDEVEKEIVRMKKEIKNETNEGFERFYSNIESNAWPYLNKALGGDISFFYSEDGFDYVIFFFDASTC